MSGAYKLNFKIKCIWIIRNKEIYVSVIVYKVVWKGVDERSYLENKYKVKKQIELKSME